MSEAEIKDREAKAKEDPFYCCGPIRYTKMGLVALFGWLLWGDFCFTMMERVIPSILPLRLKELGISNTFLSFIMGTIPGFFDITVGPLVSYKSDRWRGPLGRRIPFILYTLPFLVLSFIMVGWSEEVGVWLHRVMPVFRDVAPSTLTITLIIVFVVAYHFFNNFVGCVYYYLFNDVVPPQFLGRFNGYFKIVGGGAGALYSAFLFEHSLTHFREIITGVGILYLVGMGIMCLKVKEGPYPPPPEDEFTGFFGKFKSVGKQSFSTKFYWYFYLTSACGALAGGVGVFNVFLSQQLSLDLKQIGIMQAVGYVGGMVATYYAAVFVDRWHPLRIATYNAIGGAFGAYGGWLWLFITLPSTMFFWTSLIGSLANQFSASMAGLCGIAMFMRLMPKSLYGQFSAANSIIRACGGLFAGILAGVFLDVIKWVLNGSDFAYRFGFVWSGTFGILAAVFTCLAYREWLKLGGDEHYQAPAPWLKSGREPPATGFKSVRSIPRWLRWAMNLGLFAMVLNLGLMLFFVYEMYHTPGLHEVGVWHIKVWLPLKLWLTVASLVQYMQMLKDIRARERGEKTRWGLPHHGVWMVAAISGLVGFPVFWIKTQWMVHLHLAYELKIIGIANLVGIILGTLNVQVIRWIERDLTPAEQQKLQLQIDAEKAAAAEASLAVKTV